MHRARHSGATTPAIRPRLMVTAVVAAAALATAVWLPTRFDNAEATERGHDRSGSGQRDGSNTDAAFADAFRGGRGDSVDRARWALDARRGDGELQDFTDRNVRLDGDGNLVIAARRDGGRITSARLISRATFDAPAGRVEARIRVADDRGIRSLFQLIGTSRVDVMDNIGSNSRAIRGAVGGPGGADDTLNARRSFAEDFHTFAVEWAPDRIVWSVDGDEFFRTHETVDGPFRVALSLTVGGERAGAPDDGTRFPQRMLVDFVRVTTEQQEKPTTPPATTPTTAPTTKPPATKPPATKPPAPAAKPWKPFVLYRAGQRVTFAGITYEVKATHTSLPGWEPPVLPLLFQRVT